MSSGGLTPTGCGMTNCAVKTKNLLLCCQFVCCKDRPANLPHLPLFSRKHLSIVWSTTRHCSPFEPNIRQTPIRRQTYFCTEFQIQKYLCGRRARGVRQNWTSKVALLSPPTHTHTRALHFLSVKSCASSWFCSTFHLVMQSMHWASSLWVSTAMAISRAALPCLETCVFHVCWCGCGPAQPCLFDSDPWDSNPKMQNECETGKTGAKVGGQVPPCSQKGLACVSLYLSVRVPVLCPLLSVCVLCL